MVLPCVPATAMPRLKRISSASISARGTTGMRCARASISSGLSGLIALETTTQSAPSDVRRGVAALHASTPSDASRRVTALSAWSEPDTW